MYKYYNDHDEINSQNSSPGNFKELIQEMKNTDPGYTCIYRKVYNEKKQRMQRRKMEVYTTSSGIGANIRNAETGENFVYKISKMKKVFITNSTTDSFGSQMKEIEEVVNYKVGSLNEALFFSIIIATGECRSKNHSSTLFYSSPKQCMDHLNIVISDATIQDWEEKRNARIQVLEQMHKQTKTTSTIIR